MSKVVQRIEVSDGVRAGLMYLKQVEREELWRAFRLLCDYSRIVLAEKGGRDIDVGYKDGAIELRANLEVAEMEDYIRGMEKTIRGESRLVNVDTADRAKRQITEVLGLCDATADWDHVVGILKARIENLRKEVKESNSYVRHCSDMIDGKGHRSDMIDGEGLLAVKITQLQQEAFRLKKERDRLQAFKDYVHTRLDVFGVPIEPPNNEVLMHQREGCRIGDRLDWLITRYNEMADLKRKLDPILTNLEATDKPGPQPDLDAIRKRDQERTAKRIGLLKELYKYVSASIFGPPKEEVTKYLRLIGEAIEREIAWADGRPEGTTTQGLELPLQGLSWTGGGWDYTKEKVASPVQDGQTDSEGRKVDNSSDLPDTRFAYGAGGSD